MDRNKLKEIIELFVDSPSTALRLELMELLFTQNELEQVLARYEIIRELMKGELTQRELSADLGLSIAKITRGSNEIKRRSEALLTYLNKRIKKRKK